MKWGKFKTNDVTKSKASDVKAAQPHPHSFNPSAFHFHFSGLGNKIETSGGLEEETRKKDFGILSKLDDMFDYRKSIGTASTDKKLSQSN